MAGRDVEIVLKNAARSDFVSQFRTAFRDPGRIIDI
jgi:hypothetical protein